MICLDSDFIMALLRGDQAAVDKAKELEQDGKKIVSTANNALELYVGIVAVEGISGKRIEATRDLFPL